MLLRKPAQAIIPLHSSGKPMYGFVAIALSCRRLLSCSPEVEKIERKTFMSEYMDWIGCGTTHTERYQSTLQNLTVNMGGSPGCAPRSRAPDSS